MRPLIFILSILISSSLYAQEVIKNYDIEIFINKNRSIDVTEEITVTVEGYIIKRGIFRYVPLVVRDELDLPIVMDLDVKEVLKNGEPENYVIEGSNYVQNIKIGNRNKLLDPGIYTYTIRYNITDQVSFLEKYDEVYWNAIGHDWDLDIEKAKAVFHAPEGGKFYQFASYSGQEGNEGCNCTQRLNKDSTILTVEMTQPLPYSHGLTVGAGFNKGLVNPPSKEELRARKIKAYMPLIILGGGFFILLLYYLVAWWRVGKDPEKGSIIPRFDPPQDFSPAAVRYVMRMAYDNKVFTAALVNMAVKGYMKIDKTGKNYALTKTSDDISILSNEEKRIAGKLFGRKDYIEIKQKNHSKISRAITSLKKSLDDDFMTFNFRLNKKYIWFGVAISIITIITSLVYLAGDTEKFFVLIFMLFISLFLSPFLIMYISKINNSYGLRRAFTIVPGVLLIGYSIYFFMTLASDGTIDPRFMYSIAPYLGFFLSMIIMHIVFLILIKAPTTLGRRSMDQIEGFKMYMEIAEKHRLKMVSVPDDTPQIFEKLLPYAVALDIETKWADRFEEVLKNAIESKNYEPSWYNSPTGSFKNMNFGTISSNLGSSFSSSISSASRAPGSSGGSGSSGGGSSGGGSGGGGGGGW